ncbi:MULTISPECIES: type I 3-dehydroquinate dehydratase [Methanocalculus]|uniref:type I 3-dehydroquinate dehydratase n=1 Tax=Methanocalculus TaxID=71151 RepID=UPI00209D8783|nr:MULTISPECIES: type I 3-dehydroquinate dehydratase [unclassified Methanocalculus]MCP1661743.1 3-dehydroquinate dehydratase-1 [Methanocalculus sp. AMF5]
MNYIISIHTPDRIEPAAAEKPYALEIRLDLMDPVSPERLGVIRSRIDTPILLTLRSREEGGRFQGDADEWRAIISPLLAYADMVDIEERFSLHAGWVRSQGRQIIASYHADRMLTAGEFFDCVRRLRSFGDIPKIVLAPGNDDDAVTLLSWLVASEKPIAVSIMGSGYSWLRPVLLLLGSHLAFCHAGDETAAGQFHISEMREALRLLKGTR